MGKFKTLQKNWLLKQLALLKSCRIYLSGTSRFESVNLLLFVGYPRSGHSLLGALLDAHSQIVIAHEANAVDLLKRGIGKEGLFQLLIDESERFNKFGKQWMGYDYQVKGQWQGRQQDLKLIGDKSGGMISRKLSREEGPEEFAKIIESSGVKPTFLHVIRNPFDDITTMVKRSMDREGKPITEDDLLRKINRFFHLAEGVNRIKMKGKYRVIDVYSEQLALDTKGIMAKLCAELMVTAHPDYLLACDELVWDEPRQTRNSIPFWTAQNQGKVMQRMEAFPWFSSYSFESAT